ncbi:MAG: pseudouridine synthase [Bacteroidota bacterium]
MGQVPQEIRGRNGGLIMELDILFHDEHLVAIHKPAGLLVHQTNLDKEENLDAMRMLRDQIGQWVYPIHRLDKPTSGVLLFALSPEMAANMVDQFTHRQVEKEYLAVVRGYTQEEENIDYPLSPMWDKRTGKRKREAKPPQEAITYYRRIATTELPYPVGRYESVRYSLLWIQPKTGRSRQIRRHMKHIFHPILGDKKHGDHRQNDFLQSFMGHLRLLLHAHKLAFLHPVKETTIKLEASLSPEFKDILTKLKLTGPL